MKFNYPFGATPIDEDEAADLIPTHISLYEELNEFEEQNIIKATIKYFAKSYNYADILTFDFLLKVHKDMFDESWKWAGKTRTSIKNIGVDISQFYEQTKNLCDDVIYWINNKTYTFEEIGVRFHHRLVQIHLFPNGNGRHARFVTDLLMKNIGQPAFT